MAEGRNVPTTVKRTADETVPVRGEARWPMATAVIAAMALTVLLATQLHLRRFSLGWVLVAIEGVLLVALVLGDPGAIDRRSKLLRGLSVGLVSVMVLSALWATVVLI